MDINEYTNALKYEKLKLHLKYIILIALILDMVNNKLSHTSPVNA